MASELEGKQLLPLHLGASTADKFLLEANAVKYLGAKSEDAASVEDALTALFAAVGGEGVVSIVELTDDGTKLKVTYADTSSKSFDIKQTEIVDNLTSDSTEAALSAAQGKALKTLIDALKVKNLVAGNGIKLVNSDGEWAISVPVTDADGFLSSDASGIKLAGVKDAINSAVETETDRAKAAEKVNSDAIDVLNGNSSTAGSVAKAVADAKSDILGDAADEYNTLGKLEDKIQEVDAKASAAHTKVNKKDSGHVTVSVEDKTTADGVSYSEVTVAENDIASAADLTAEITRAKKAEDTNATAISTEKSRAEGVESGLDTRLTTVEGKIPTEASSTNQLADKSYVTDAVKESTDAVEAEKTRAEGAETTLTNNLDAEITRAKAAEDTIEASVGLNADGTHKTTSGNYTSSATTVVGEIAALDTQVKTNADAIAAINPVISINCSYSNYTWTCDYTFAQLLDLVDGWNSSTQKRCNIPAFVLTGLSWKGVGDFQQAYVIAASAFVGQTTENSWIQFLVSGASSDIFNGSGTDKNLKLYSVVLRSDKFVADSTPIGSLAYTSDIKAYTGSNAIGVNDTAISLEINSNDKVLSQDSSGLLSTLSLVYNSTNKKIYLYGKDSSSTDKAISSIDATDFIKDGMLKSAEYSSDTHILTLTFNTDAGEDPIKVDLSDLVDTYKAGDGLALADDGTFSVDDTIARQTAVDNCVKKTGENSQQISGDVIINGDLTVNDKTNITDLYLSRDGVNGADLQYDPDLGIAVRTDNTGKDYVVLGRHLAESISTYNGQNIDELTSINCRSRVNNANTNISGTLPDGVTKADDFRLEVLPLGGSKVEQRLSIVNNGEVITYSRVYDGTSYGSWVSLSSTWLEF